MNRPHTHTRQIAAGREPCCNGCCRLSPLGTAAAAPLAGLSSSRRAHRGSTLRAPRIDASLWLRCSFLHILLKKRSHFFGETRSGYLESCFLWCGIFTRAWVFRNSGFQLRAYKYSRNFTPMTSCFARVEESFGLKNKCRVMFLHCTT